MLLLCYYVSTVNYKFWKAVNGLSVASFKVPFGMSSRDYKVGSASRVTKL